MKRRIVLLFALCLMMAGTANAGKLLLPEGNGFKAGEGAAVFSDAKSLTLEMAVEYDAQQIAEQLKSKLPGVLVDNPIGTNTIKLSGLPLAQLQSKLSAVDVELTPAADPLAALGSLGSDSTLLMAGPEVGGSIRASNPMIMSPDFVASAGEFQESRVEDRFTARVVSVEQGNFPEVVLNIKVRQVNGRGARVNNNESYRAVVLFPGFEGHPDLSLKCAQTNLAAYYLQTNDKIEGHLLRKEQNTIYLDFVQRIP